MALPKLTARQQEVLELIQTSITATGAPPPGQKLPRHWALNRPMPPKST